jgi:hypothetical protein
LGAATGLTRDISTTGIFFETDASFAPSGTIRMDITIETPGGPLMLHCLGSIVRVERRDTRLGLAVRILETALRAAAPQPG